MVRVAGLHDQVDAGIDARGPDGLLAARDDRADLRAHPRAGPPPLAAVGGARPAGARRARHPSDRHCEECDRDELDAIDRQFSEQIFPVLTPLAVGPGRPFPYISNLSLSLAVWLRDPVSGTETFARVKVPKEVLPRFVPIGDDVYVPLESVIARHLDQLFPGMEILRHDFFRVTRDADFTVSDEADDLLRAVEDELRRRRFGEVVRLEVSSSMDPDMRSYLVEQLGDRRGAGDRRRGPARPRRPVVALRGRGPPRAARPAVDAGHPAGARRPRRRQGGRVRRDARGRPAPPPPLRLVRHERRAPGPAGRGGPRRARDQDDRVPHLRRFASSCRR